MPGKTATERVDDVVQFLETTTVVPLASRKAAAAVVKLYLADQHSTRTGPAFTQLSQNMSLGARPSGQATGPRQMARAIYLLWQVMSWAEVSTRIPFANAAAVPTTNIDVLLESTIYKALVVYEAKQNRPLAARYVLETLMPADPIRFLSHNRLTIAGSPVRDAGQGARNVLDFCFGFDPSRDRWRIFASNMAGFYPFQAASIAATHWTAVPNRTTNPNAGSFAAIDAIEIAGSGIVVTTQFTGCSLCFRMSAGKLYAAHISPGAQTTPPILPGGGPKLAEQLLGQVPGVTAADFANAPGPAPLTIYGREHSNHPAYPGGYGGPNLMQFTMIGFGTASGGWSLYSQELVTGEVITNVRQIHP